MMPALRFLRSIRRRGVAACLALAFSLAPAASVGLAQEPPPEDAPAPTSSGEPWQGYAAFGFVAVMALFIVCKSARRS